MSFSLINKTGKFASLPAHTGEKAPKKIIRTETIIVETPSGNEAITRNVIEEEKPLSDLEYRILQSL